jgi:hypothetical protein
MGTTDASPSGLAGEPPATAHPAPPPAPHPATPIPTPATPAPSEGAGEALSASRMVTANHVALVRTNSPIPASAETLPLVTITKTELLVGKTHVADVVPGPLGFEAAIKRAQNRAALQVLPIEAALRPIHDAAPSQSTLRVLVDATTSYRTALEVLFTAGQSGFRSFAFVVYNPAVGERAVPASTPSRAERDAAHAPGAAPPVSFLLQADGVVISVGGERIGPGCVKGAAGTTVPLRDGKADLAGLAACASRIKGLAPAWAGSTVAEVTAIPGLDMQTVLAAVAAVIRDYPVVHFGLLSS